uniref:Uncharacterized protein n=1 Tax=Lepeophtheirus salmonis TaxID=72036 RepID=A0A0K2TQH1_LEPSM
MEHRLTQFLVVGFRLCLPLDGFPLSFPIFDIPPHFPNVDLSVPQGFFFSCLVP